VRIENETPGSSQRLTPAERHIRTIVDQDPGEPWVNTLDRATQTARGFARMFVGLGAGGGRWAFTVPIGGAQFLTFHRVQDLRARRAWNLEDEAFNEEPLGIERIAGVDVVGRRDSLTIPVGHIGNDRPIEIVDEQWLTLVFRMAIYPHHSEVESVDAIGRRYAESVNFSRRSDRATCNLRGWYVTRLVEIPHDIVRHRFLHFCWHRARQPPQRRGLRR
jgi:hypothetical protein